MLAALASAAVRGLHPVRTATLDSGAGDVDVAVVEDDQHRSWVVRAPRSPGAGAALESELVLLAGLRDAPRTGLTFAVPDPAGFAPLPEGGRCVVHPLLPGVPLHPRDLRPGPGTSAALGRALASLHEVPRGVVEDAGLPVYDAEEYRQRRLSELDRAAGTGYVPARLLTRWEKALEDVGRWRFRACVVHGDLVADHVLVAGRDVVAVLDWGEAKVADPADDLAWLAVGADESALESVLEAYTVGRSGGVDRHLPVRARLAGELALCRWLLHGVRTDTGEVVDDAVGMLRDLDADVGGDTL